MEKHKVICPYCGAGCQFNLLVQNGQVVGTEPLNGITNQSELCLKGMSGYDFINDTKILTPRVLHPMIRRTKGADLERVSWDEALDFTASKMQAIIDEYGPNAVMTTGSSRGAAMRRTTSCRSLRVRASAPTAWTTAPVLDTALLSSV